MRGNGRGASDASSCNSSPSLVLVGVEKPWKDEYMHLSFFSVN